MRENRIVKIERDVSESRAGRTRDVEIVVVSHGRDGIGRKGIDFDVAGAFAKFERANQSIRNDAEVNPFERRRTAEIIRIAVEDDVFVRGETEETKWATADGMLREIRAGVLRDDADGLSREVKRKRGVRRAKMKDDGVRIRSGNEVNERIGAALRCFDGAGNDRVESEFHVGGSEWLAVGKFHVVAKMEDVSLRVRHLPFLGEVRRKVEVLVALQEAVEHEEVEMLGECVGSNARVEVGRHGFEEEVESMRIGGGAV